LIGTTISHFRVTGTLGAGGMGVVYRARDETLGREVALKLLPADAVADPDARARLLREARTASALGHPGICAVHEVGEDRGQVFIAMELIAGRPLGERIPAHGLPAATAIDYGVQIAAALAHAHERGVIHRDLKTSNVMIAADGRAKILDFGLAKLLPGATGAMPGAVSTTTGVVSGTPQYMAPEVLRGERADARSDLWALGVVLYEMAAGAPPFRGETGFELGAAILNAEPLPLPASLPAGMRTVIARCLAKDPAQRYQRADEARAVLEAAQQGLSGAVTAGPVVPPVTARRGPRSRLLTGTAFLLPILAFLGLALNQGGVRDRLFGGANAERIRSLAVLPLENLSRDPEQEFFADGMTDELIARLASLEGVRVISRTSTMRYKGTTKGIPQIGRELGVDAVIEGSALRADGRVRITAQLIRAAQERHLWAKSYERDLRDVLALQAEVAQAIAGEIRAALAPEARSRAAAEPPVNPEAYEAYLRGRYYWNKRNSAALKQAIVHFRRALATDSTYALAHAGLADVYAVIGDYLDRPATETAPAARASALRALELDPRLAEPHAALGLVKMEADFDWAGAEAEFREALRLNPNYATALHWHAILLVHLGRSKEALAEIDRALAVDPLALIIRNTRGRILQTQRRWAEAMSEYRRVLELDPAFSVTYIWIARNQDARGQHPLAVASYRTADSLVGNDLHGYDALMRAAREPDPRTYWRQNLIFLSDAAHRSAVLPSLLAESHAQLGETGPALALLERAFRERDGPLLDVIRDSGLDPLRNDPRFADLLRGYGLEP